MEISAVFTTVTPTQWQAPPEWMNFHYLVRAEQCARSAALRHATYSQLWNRRGYPDKPSLAALSGMVMHRAIARLIRALADSGIGSFEDPRSVAILKSLGGYSKVIGESVTDVFRSLTGNPRFDLVSSSSLSRLNSRLPSIREQVQLQLSRLKWKLQPPPVDPTEDSDIDTVAGDRVPLEQGTHFEVELRHPGIKWRGFADLIELHDDFCIIEDFKSGEPSDDHLLQLQIYALLWSHDDELNPAKTAVDKLVISYPIALWASLGVKVRVRFRTRYRFANSFRSRLQLPNKVAASPLVVRDDPIAIFAIRHQRSAQADLRTRQQLVKHHKVLWHPPQQYR